MIQRPLEHVGQGCWCPPTIYNETRGPFSGLAIGLLNNANELHGVQLGLINIARNNRGIARVLPLINLHLD